MSSRTFAPFALVAASAGPAVVLLALASAPACSDDGPSPDAPEAGADARPEANRPAPPEADAAPTCRESCETAHPGGLPSDEAINSCWETHCYDPCIEGRPADGGPGNGDAAVDAGACAAPVVTISADCDECTHAWCCAAWDACFLEKEAECAALNACYQRCSD